VANLCSSFIVRMLYKDIILVTHFFTILLLRSLDFFLSLGLSLLHFIIVTLRFVKVV